MYNPVIARFMQEDTYRGKISDPLSLNLYTYCVNNPLIYYDPDGHVVTTWDMKNLNKAQQASLGIQTRLYDTAKAKGDTAGMAAAHTAAEIIRNTGRSSSEVGSASGYTYTVSSNGSASLNKYDSAALAQATNGGGSTLNGSSYMPEINVSAEKIIIENIISMMPAFMPMKSTNNVQGQSINYNNLYGSLAIDTSNVYGANQYKFYIDLGDPKASEAYSKWINSNPQLRYQYDLRYSGMSVPAFQDKLLDMSRKGKDLSKYTVADLDKLFEEEADFQVGVFSSIPAGKIVGGIVAGVKGTGLLDDIIKFFTGGSKTADVVVRQAYVNEVRGLSNIEQALRAEGKSTEEIARVLHQARRELGVQYKNMTSPEMLEQIYDRNLNKYGDKLGPSIEYLRGRGKTWEQIVESAKTPGQEYNDLANIK